MAFGEGIYAASMRPNSKSRRRFLIAASVFAAAPLLVAEPDEKRSVDDATANDFLVRWGNAWNSHDAHAMSLVHTDDAVTVNRFGTLVQGREALEKALGFLHGAGGPFHDATLAPLKLIGVRRIAPDVIILQASWKSPVMNPDGKLNLTKMDDMIVSYTLLRTNTGWGATEVDLHNVEKMDLPFSNNGQKS